MTLDWFIDWSITVVSGEKEQCMNIKSSITHEIQYPCFVRKWTWIMWHKYEANVDEFPVNTLKYYLLLRLSQFSSYQNGRLGKTFFISPPFWIYQGIML